MESSGEAVVSSTTKSLPFTAKGGVKVGGARVVDAMAKKDVLFDVKKAFEMKKDAIAFDAKKAFEFEEIKKAAALEVKKAAKKNLEKMAEVKRSVIDPREEIGDFELKMGLFEQKLVSVDPKYAHLDTKVGKLDPALLSAYSKLSSPVNSSLTSLQSLASGVRPDFPPRTANSPHRGPPNTPPLLASHSADKIHLPYSPHFSPRDLYNAPHPPTSGYGGYPPRLLPQPGMYTHPNMYPSHSGVLRPPHLYRAPHPTRDLLKNFPGAPPLDRLPYPPLPGNPLTQQPPSNKSLEPSEFSSGLFSYFSSQHEDDME